MRVASPPSYRLSWWTIVQSYLFSRHAWWSKVSAAFADEPIPLGVSLVDASGDEF